MLGKMRDYLLALVVIFGSWHLGSSIMAKPFLPTPLAVIQEFSLLLIKGQLLSHFLISSYRVFLSLAISFLLAVPLGLVMGRTPALDRIAAPVIYVLYPLPKSVFLPIIVVFLGLGNLPKIVLICLIVFFQIVVTARDAARNIPLQSLLSLKSLHATTWQTYRHLVWPYCLPKILTSLRVSLGTAIAVLFLAETFASTDGLGYFILDAMERKEYPAMYAGILAMGLLGVITYALVDLMENHLCKWTKY